MTNDLNNTQNQATSSGQTDGEDSAENFDALEALTRLLVGGVLEGSDELLNRLKEWDAATAVSSETTSPTQPDTAAQLRYALIGALFSAEARFKKTQLPFIKRAGQLGLNMAATAVAPFTKIGASTGVNAQLEEWSQRGETILSQWTERGRDQEQHSRAVARYATTETVNELLNQLAENKELQNLISEQSTGIATEALDQARERTVTADDLAERLVRTILRRSPREQTSLPAHVETIEGSHENN